MRTAALSGVVIADFTRVLAGPYATMLLGDLGAEVIKIERPDGGDDTRSWGPPYADGEATYFSSVNRNKQSITLDLNDPADVERARELIRRADVVAENFRPGAMDRLRLGYAHVRELNPRAIYCSITGFGRTEGANLPGYDLLVQAVGGLMSITGEADAEPNKIGVALVDVLTGLHAGIGILAALRHRDRTGEGQRVEVSLMSSMLSALVNQASSYVAGGVVPQRMGNRHPSIAPYEVFTALDTSLVLAVGNDRQFAALCKAMKVPDLADDPRFTSNADRVHNRDALKSALERVLTTRPAGDWFETFSAVGVPCGPIQDIAAAFSMAGDLGLDPIVEMVSPDNGNVVRQVASPIGLSATPATYRRVPPKLGQDRAAVLARLGEDT